MHSSSTLVHLLVDPNKGGLLCISLERTCEGGTLSLTKKSPLLHGNFSHVSENNEIKC